MRKKHCIVLCSFLILAILLAGLYECEVFGKDNSRQKDYGVFLSLDASDMDRITEYQTVVIDAQYFSKKDIAYLKKQGCTVYSYINIGAIENFREYYDEYSNLALGDYENWEEEKWVDVSSTVWQNFLVSLEEELLDKSIDGFFVDNCDVYYVYHTDDVFEGLTTILEHLMEYGKPVIINGGDTYVMEYEAREGSLQRIMTGVNQECVWSRINFKKGSFSAQNKIDREYFQDYIETCDRQGCDVYLIEYTTDRKLKRKIKKYCKKNRFHYYISDSIELD
ncbi:MAG: endo alpha-1,4 polygalactosaminidase [Lachnospiraceae bacterium]|nr:endo alpha-1,4 polygalactosaminidase [Lachnospiraceae bacterium]